MAAEVESAVRREDDSHDVAIRASRWRGDRQRRIRHGVRRGIREQEGRLEETEGEHEKRGGRVGQFLVRAPRHVPQASERRRDARRRDVREHAMPGHGIRRRPQLAGGDR